MAQTLAPKPSAEFFVSSHAVEQSMRYAFILRGYRRNLTLCESIKSLLFLHNETWNVWIHLVGFFIFAGALVHCICMQDVRYEHLKVIDWNSSEIWSSTGMERASLFVDEIKAAGEAQATFLMDEISAYRQWNGDGLWNSTQGAQAYSEYTALFTEEIRALGSSCWNRDEFWNVTHSKVEALVDQFNTRAGGWNGDVLWNRTQARATLMIDSMQGLGDFWDNDKLWNSTQTKAASLRRHFHMFVLRQATQMQETRMAAAATSLAQRLHVYLLRQAADVRTQLQTQADKIRPLPSTQSQQSSYLMRRMEAIRMTHRALLEDFALLPDMGGNAGSSPSVDNSIERWPLYVFVLSAMACLWNSAAYHLLGMANIARFQTMSCIDFVGIIGLIFGSIFPVVWYGFHDLLWARCVHLGGLVTIGGILVVLSTFPFFHTAQLRPLKTGMFIGMGAFCVFPLVHLLYKCEFDAMSTTLFFGATRVSGLYVAGAAIYIKKFPECLAPGKFDLFFSSHQLWHLFVLIAACSHYHIVLNLRSDVQQKLNAALL